MKLELEETLRIYKAKPLIMQMKKLSVRANNLHKNTQNSQLCEN